MSGSGDHLQGVDIEEMIECASALSGLLGITPPPRVDLRQKITEILTTRRLVEAVDKQIILEREAATGLVERLMTWMFDRSGGAYSDSPNVDVTPIIDQLERVFSKRS